MKKKYIAPTVCNSKINIQLFLHTVSPFAVKNAAVDGSYNGPNSSDTKVVNGASSFSQDANERGGGFGDDSGPWESLW